MNLAKVFLIWALLMPVTSSALTVIFSRADEPEMDLVHFLQTADCEEIRNSPKFHIEKIERVEFVPLYNWVRVVSESRKVCRIRVDREFAGLKLTQYTRRAAEYLRESLGTDGTLICLDDHLGWAPGGRDYGVTLARPYEKGMRGGAYAFKFRCDFGF